VTATTVERVPLAIIGAGFAGIGFAARLRAAGVEDFVVLERGERIGGTWRDNTYPGCACDVPSHLYSYSFAPNPGWSRAFAGQPEILAYLERVAADHGVLPHVRTGVELLGATWDQDRRCWRLRTSAGPLDAGVVVAATGLFGAPVLPDIPGRESFTGTAFHSLRWPPGEDLTGRRVAVIGTGASAIQFVPEIQPRVAQLTVFQRTPPWILPKPDAAIPGPVRALLRRPGVHRALRAAQYAFFESSGAPSLIDARLGAGAEAIGRWWLRRQVPEPELRARLTPDYRLGCKRVLFSGTYLRALRQPNAAVVTDAVTEIRERAIVTADGREHPVDAIVYGTGFQVPPGAGALFTGRDGRTVLDHYRDRPQSYLGMTYSGFPNLFQFFGPFGAASNQSAIYMLESQYAYVLDALRTLDAEGLASVEVRPEVQARFTDDMEARSGGTAWVSGGCRSYYQTPTGGNAGLWPGWSFSYRRRTASFDPRAYVLEDAAAVAA
jgi:cation diffusion facilitator CzcD-associated flavoprotein CzcO